MSGKERKCLLLIIIVLIAACIETDIYLPAFADMMVYFSVSEETIQSLLTWNFIGICVSGLIYGPASDAYGRKKPLIVALGLFLAGSIMTLFAHTFDIMLAGRLLQGLGSGGCFTLGTTIIFDSFQREKAVKVLNQINAIIPVIMAAAPLVGGYLNETYGFRSNFLAIGIFVLLSCIICFLFFEETLAKEKQTPLKVKKILGDFKRALTNSAFNKLNMLVSLLFANYLVFLSITAVLFVIEFGVSKQEFPYFQAAILGAWLAGNLSSSRVITAIGIPKVKIIGTCLMTLGGVGLAMMSQVTPQNPYLLTAIMLVHIFGANWVFGLYFPEAMEIMPDIKGITASILTSSRLLITALVIGLASLLYDGTIYPVAYIVVAATMIILPTIILHERRKTTSLIKSL